jgi:hypothetical protein
MPTPRKALLPTSIEREVGKRPPPPSSTRLDPFFALHLKEAQEQAARELKVRILSARLTRVYDPTERDFALFELETERGSVHAILSRAGEYSFFWKK